MKSIAVSQQQRCVLQLKHPRSMSILLCVFHIFIAASPINSAGGAIRVNLLFCPVGKVGFRPPPDDRIPPAINVPLIDETFRKKVSYFWRVKIDFNGQSRSAKGVRDLIPPPPLAAAASVEVEVVIPAAPAANTVALRGPAYLRRSMNTSCYTGGQDPVAVADSPSTCSTLSGSRSSNGWFSNTFIPN